MLWPWLGARSSMMILFCSWACHLVFTQHKTMSVRQCWQTDLFLLNIFLKLYQISKRIWTYLTTIVSCSETMFRCLFSNQIKYNKINNIILNDWWRKVLIAIIFLLPCWWDCSLSWLIYINTRISRRVTIVTQCHNCDALCHNCDILFVKMLELGSEIIPKN